MLTHYINTAMARATFQTLEDGTYIGEIAAFDDLSAQGATLEECRKALEYALEDRILLMLDFGDEPPDLEEL